MYDRRVLRRYIRQEAWVLALVGLLTACKRPVDRPTYGDTIVTELNVIPEFVREGVPIEVRFRLLGAPPQRVEYAIAQENFECTPESLADGQFVCRHPGIQRGAFVQGSTPVFLTAWDQDGQLSTAEGLVHIDFDCPRILALDLSKEVAQPGDIITLGIDASEPLRVPPRVSRLGRDWGLPEGDGQAYQLAHTITSADPAPFSDIIVSLTDRAGNTSGDCGVDAAIAFAVDQRPPVVNVQKILLERQPPGLPATITASVGAFSDDVEIERVRILDDQGKTVLAILDPEDDGSLAPTPLGTGLGSRIQIEALDRFGRRSELQSVPERWRLSVASGSTPGAGLRTGTRLNPAHPASRSMLNRTVELAPDVFAQDTRSAVVRANVGFRKVGDLPSRFEGANRMAVGYDPVGKAIISAGGYRGNTYNFYDEYMNDVLVLTWDEREGIYVVERGPFLSFEDPMIPAPRFGGNISFNEQGCGLMFGGDVRIEEFRSTYTDDAWLICHTPGGYQWRPINYTSNADLRRIGPSVWDPINRRFVLAGGALQDSGRVAFLEQGMGFDDWTMRTLEALPTTYTSRFNGFLYFDPVLRGVAVGLGGVSPIGNGEQYIVWSYVDGQWLASQVPLRLGFLSRFGWAYDRARRHLAVWGGNTRSTADPLTEVNYLTQTSTHGEEAWRRGNVDHPVARDYPAMVYDSDREVSIVFGGTRVQSGNNRIIEPEIHELVSAPAYPYLQASIDLGAPRPKGIDRLLLKIGASGVGDLDGLGPLTNLGGGVVVMLWDHQLRRWIEVASSMTPPEQGIVVLDVNVTERPERYITDFGVLPITIRSRLPATETRSARLEVDWIDGHMELRPGVSLP